MHWYCEICVIFFHKLNIKFIASGTTSIRFQAQQIRQIYVSTTAEKQKHNKSIHITSVTHTDL